MPEKQHRLNKYLWGTQHVKKQIYKTARKPSWDRIYAGFIKMFVVSFPSVSFRHDSQCKTCLRQVFGEKVFKWFMNGCCRCRKFLISLQVFLFKNIEPFVCSYAMFKYSTLTEKLQLWVQRGLTRTYFSRNCQQLRKFLLSLKGSFGYWVSFKCNY